MNVIVKLDNLLYEQIKEHGDVSEFHKLILNGTPIPDNATNLDVSGVCEHDKQIVLDKIRAEVTALKSHHINDSYDDGFQGFRIEVLDILDKYKAESEEE